MFLPYAPHTKPLCEGATLAYTPYYGRHSAPAAVMAKKGRGRPRKRFRRNGQFQRREPTAVATPDEAPEQLDDSTFSPTEEEALQRVVKRRAMNAWKQK